MHRDGFASAGLLKNDKERGKENEGIEEDGKVRVQLDYNGDIIEVSKICVLYKVILSKCIILFAYISIEILHSFTG